MTSFWEAARLVTCYLRDEYVFPIFQVCLLLVLLYAVWKDLGLIPRIRKRFFRGGSFADLQVVRGSQSREYFHLAYGLASILVLQIVNVADAWKTYKTIVSLADLGVLLYLAYFSAWMRNRVIAFVVRWQNRPG